MGRAHPFDRRPAILPALLAITGIAAAAAALPAAPAAAEELTPVTIRISSDTAPPPQPVGMAQEFFKERLAEIIPGSEVRIFYAGSLYSSIGDSVAALTEGNLEMTWGQFAKTGDLDPYANVVTGPLLLTTPGAMQALDTLPSFKKLVERFDKMHDVTIFGTGHLSMFNGVGATRRLVKPEDFAGAKIRSPGASINAIIESWGANATAMPFGDVPSALQTGVLDGLITSLSGFVITRDQAPYFTIAGLNSMIGDYYYVAASNIWLDSLNEPTRDAIRNLLVNEVVPFQKKINWCTDKRVLDRYETKDPAQPGIYLLSEAEQKVLADRVGTSTTDWIKRNTPDDANPWIDQFVQEARAASQAHPIGSSDLEKTDCSELAPWFERFQRS